MNEVQNAILRELALADDQGYRDGYLEGPARAYAEKSLQHEYNAGYEMGERDRKRERKVVLKQ